MCGCGMKVMSVMRAYDIQKAALHIERAAAFFNICLKLLTCDSRTSFAAHHPRHLLDPLKRKRRRRQWLHRNRHQFHGIVICCHAIGTEAAAHATTVNDRPLSVFPDPHGYRLHMTAAVRRPVSGFYIHMQAVQAVGTMVPVIAAGSCRHDRTSAYFARKCLVTGMIFVISFFKSFSLILSIQLSVLLKIVHSVTETNFSGGDAAAPCGKCTALSAQ